MPFSYNPLWKLLIDKGVGRDNLRKTIGISSSTMAKMGKGENVSLEVLEKICQKLNCKIEEVIEYIPLQEEKED